MISAAPPSFRMITPDELPVIAALNQTAYKCVALNRCDDAEAILRDAIAVYGRLPPFLVCLYSAWVTKRGLDAAKALEALADVFTPAELKMPMFRLIWLTLTITSLAELPGYHKQVASALAEARTLASDPKQDNMVRTRAAALLVHAGEPVPAAA